MDYFRRAFDDAKALAGKASEHAQRLGREVSQHTRNLAESAQIGADEARQSLQKLNIASLASSLKTAHKEGPTRDELARYGISDELVEYLRSLTYTNFRDFRLEGERSASSESLPEEPLQAAKPEGCQATTHLLTTWQVKHVTLVLQHVKELQDLRFVLCPRRMTEERFWEVYFCLARQYLPPEAHMRGADPDTAVPSMRADTIAEMEVRRGTEDPPSCSNGAGDGWDIECDTEANTESWQVTGSDATNYTNQLGSHEEGVSAGKSRMEDGSNADDDMDLEAYLNEALGGRLDAESPGHEAAREGSRQVDAVDAAEDDFDDLEDYLKELEGDEDAVVGNGAKDGASQPREACAVDDDECQQELGEGGDEAVDLEDLIQKAQFCP